MFLLAAVGCSAPVAPPTPGAFPVEGVRQLTTDSAYYQDLIWSPDSRLLAATRCPVVNAEPRCLHQQDTVLLSPETATQDHVDFGSISPETIAGRPIAWSPQRDEVLLYVEARAPGDQGVSTSRYSYVLFNPATGQFEALSIPGTAIAWDVAGERLLSVQGAEAGGLALGWLVMESGEFVPELTLSEREGSMGPYALSSDGQALLRADSPLVNLCNQVDKYRIGSNSPFEPYLSRSCFPSWSPDGSMLVYAEKDRPEDLPSRLVIIQADGSNPRSLFGGETISGLSSPAWSPDGRWIAFTRTGLGNTNAVYLAPVPGSSPP